LWLALATASSCFKEQELDANLETHILFELTNFKGMVLFWHKRQDSEELEDGKWKIEPTPKVCYHNMEEVLGGGAGDFKRHRKHPIPFGVLDQELPNDTSTEQTLNRVGALILTDFWKSHCLTIYWRANGCMSGCSLLGPWHASELLGLASIFLPSLFLLIIILLLFVMSFSMSSIRLPAASC
jgi:hypothetical protein